MFYSSPSGQTGQIVMRPILPVFLAFGLAGPLPPYGNPTPPGAVFGVSDSYFKPHQPAQEPAEGALTASAAPLVEATTPDSEAQEAFLAPPQPTGPEDGMVLPSIGPVTLRWDNPPGAAQLHVRVTPEAVGPDISVIIADPALVSAASFTVEAPARGGGNYVLLPGATYAWQVRATAFAHPAAEGDPIWGDWSHPWRFRTPVASGTSIAPLFPPDGDAATGSSTTLYWLDRVKSVSYHEVQVSTDPQFRTGAGAIAPVWWNLVHGGPNPTTAWGTPALEADRTYYWRVRPWVPQGHSPNGGRATAVDWSPTWRFKSRPSLAALAEQALDRINGERTARGLVPLLPNDLLSRIALQQSRDMARQGLMSHSGLDGSDPAQRAAQEGYRGQGVAEVVGMGFNDAGQVIAAWMGSPDHQKVLLAAGLREAGIGVAESSGGSLFWTVDLGLPE